MNVLHPIIRRIQLLENDGIPVTVIDGHVVNDHSEIQTIIDLCNVVLRNEDGTNHWPRIRQMRKAGYRVVPGIEHTKDKQRWITGHIETVKGIIEYECK